MEKQWDDFYLGGFFKRVETTASQKAKSTEQAKACDDVFLHVHYVYVCIIYMYMVRCFLANLGILNLGYV